jgi:general secretion pathway protein G
MRERNGGADVHEGQPVSAVEPLGADSSASLPPSALSPVPSRRFRPGGQKGFTLMELMVVVAIIGILVSMAVPTYRTIVERAKETVLRENLYTLRDVIDQYYADKGKYPDSLESLVSAGYLRRLPIDPITGKSDWVTVPYSGNEPGQMEPTEGESTGGIWDVHSASDAVGSDGTKYSTW